MIKPPTGPGPISWLRNQPTLHRVSMHIVQLLKPFPLAPNVHVIEPSLPDPVAGMTVNSGRQPDPLKHLSGTKDDENFPSDS